MPSLLRFRPVPGRWLSALLLVLACIAATPAPAAAPPAGSSAVGADGREQAPSATEPHRLAQHQPRASAPGRAPPALTGEDIDRLTSLLQDESRRAEFLRTLEALKAAGGARAGTAGEGTLPDGNGARPQATTEPETAPPAARPAATPAQPQPAAPAAAAQPQPAAPAAAAQPQPAAPAAAAQPQPAAPAAVAQPPQAPPAAGQPTAAPAAAPQPGAPAAAAPVAQPAAPAEPIIAPNTTGALVLQWFAGLQDHLGPVSRELLDAVRNMADLPGLWRGLQSLATNPVARTRALDAAWILLLLAGIGLFVEHALWRTLRRARERLDAMAPPEGKRWSWLRRLPLFGARLVLDLLPIAAFLGVVHLLLGLLVPLPTTRVIALRAAEVYVAARGVFAVARLFLAPRAHRLRLIPVSDRAAHRALRWLRRLLWVGLGGYTLAEAGIALGLSWGAYDAIINITLLICSLQLTYMVIRSREAVATVLRAPPLDPIAPPPDRGRRMLRGLRNGVAGIWHVLTILWLLAAWVVWALAIEDGISRLLTSTLLAIGIGLAAKGVDEAIALGLNRMVAPNGAAGAAGVPRAATWQPVLRTLASMLVTICGLLLLFWIWGIDSFSWFSPGTLGNRLLGTLASIGVTFVAAALVWEVSNAAIARRLTRLARESGQSAARSARVRTLLPMLRTVLSIVIIVFLALSTLSELGVNVAPLLAGAGVVGLAIGFGSQTLVRDVITGVFLLLEDAVAVGDVVQLASLSGVVENLSIRSIKLRALDGSLHIIPFSAVTTVTNMTRDFSFAVMDVQVGYGEDSDHVAEVLREIGKEMRAEAKWKAMMRDDLEVMGVEKFGDSGIVIRARAKTEPAARWNVARELNRRIKQRFDALGIEIPYPYQRLVMDQPGSFAPSRPRAAE